MVDGLHNCDDNPNLYIAAHNGVGLPPLSGEAAGQAFQCGIRLVAQKAFYLDEKS